MARTHMKLLSVVAVAAALALRGPALAPAGNDGYVWAHQPAVASYPVTTGYEHNSAGGAVSIVRSGPGRYEVRFVGLAAPGGVAHAVAYGSDNSDFCAVQSWGRSLGDLIVRVRCYDGTGAPADTRFVANFTDHAPLYLWANDPTNPAPYAPNATYTHDDLGGPVTVDRLSPGRYRVTAPTIGALLPTYRQAHIRATAYGTAPVRCEVLEPNALGVQVNCYDVDANPVDSRFTLSASQSSDLLGRAVPHGSANIWPNPAAPPTVMGWTNPGGAPTATQIAEGLYRVTFPGLAAPRGHVVANAFGTPPAYCNVGGWWPSGTSQVVSVGCFDATNHESTVAFFTVSFLG